MKKSNRWSENQKKAETMCRKFIAVLEQLDCYDTWAAILVDAIIEKKKGEDEETEDIVSTLEANFGFRVVKIENLAQEYRLEQFIQEIENNPAQLQLIA